VTGESIPVDKAVGDMVFAGTINETGMLELRVTAAASNTTLARIIHAVEQAQGAGTDTALRRSLSPRSTRRRVCDCRRGGPADAPRDAGWSWTEALYKALVLLVIACPCAW
jgi:Cd2+/Zn2+-exporting ATPase